MTAQPGRRATAPSSRAVRWSWFTGMAHTPASTTRRMRAVSFHPGGNDVPESLPLILGALVILMGLGAISGAVIVAGLALFDELSNVARPPR